MKNRTGGRVYYHRQLMYCNTVMIANYSVLRSADFGWFRHKGLGVVEEFQGFDRQLNET